jgi:predicted lactoylglutathione lyase
LAGAPRSGFSRCPPSTRANASTRGARACITSASARAREDVDTLYGFLQQTGATIVHPPEDGPFAPGYYSVLFEDPDGVRLECNFVPGRGLLDGKS